LRYFSKKSENKDDTLKDVDGGSNNQLVKQYKIVPVANHPMIPGSN